MNIKLAISKKNFSYQNKDVNVVITLAMKKMRKKSTEISQILEIGFPFRKKKRLAEAYGLKGQ
jgi:hypothetical protein